MQEEIVGRDREGRNGKEIDRKAEERVGKINGEYRREGKISKGKGRGVDSFSKSGLFLS